MAILSCRAALLTLLDQVDYAASPPACRVNEMVGAVIPAEVLKLCRHALASEREADETLRYAQRLTGEVIALGTTAVLRGAPNGVTLAAACDRMIHRAAAFAKGGSDASSDSR